VFVLILLGYLITVSMAIKCTHNQIINIICCEFRSKISHQYQTMMCGAKESGNQYQSNNKQSTMINNST